MSTRKSVLDDGTTPWKEPSYPSAIVGDPRADVPADVVQRPHHEAVEVLHAVPLERKDGDVGAEEEEDDDALPRHAALVEELGEEVPEHGRRDLFISHRLAEIS